MEAFRIFLVEDNALFAKATRHHLMLNPSSDVELFETGKACLQALHRKPHLVFLDYSLPDMSGEEVLKNIKKSNRDIPVVIVSGQEDVSTAVNLLKQGAYDYIVKDDNARERMWNAVNNLRENISLRKELDQLREEVGHKYDFSNIKGSSPAIRKVFQLIEKAARTNITVSISGETGTGKELVAKAIHYNSTQRRKPLVSVNIGAIPADLMESELFGHEKGAFTGAANRRIGKFEEASEGTLFLDEIAELDLPLQTKLLRVIQEKEVTRLGSNKVIAINPRIIVATHKNLAEEVNQGRFREDLYYRILGLPIELPPLRERGNDILLLAKYFLDQFLTENQLAKVELSTNAQTALLNYSWPGNVRELKAVVELAAVLADEEKIEEEHIRFNATRNELEQVFKQGRTLKEYTRLIVQYHLEQCGYNVVEVARQLDIGKSTIYRMLKNQEIEMN